MQFRIFSAQPGIASAVNNPPSRLGRMIAVAALPLAAGLSGTDFEDPAKLAAGFPVAMTIAAGASFAAALLTWTTIRDDALSRPAADTKPAAEELPSSLQRHCAVAGTPAGHLPPSAARFPPADSQMAVTVWRRNAPTAGSPSRLPATWLTAARRLSAGTVDG